MTNRLARATMLAAALMIVSGPIAAFAGQTTSGAAPQQGEGPSYAPPSGEDEPSPIAVGLVRLANNPANSAPVQIGFSVGNMTYHGGPVQHGQKVFTIFWNPSGTTAFPAGYQTTINQFVQDLNGSPYYSIASQYSDGAGNISTSVTFGGTWLDTTNAIPDDPPTLGDLITEASRAIAANGWASDANSYFQIYTPSGFGVSAGYCGFHITSSPAVGLILFPSDHLPSGTCFPSGPYPNNQAVDAAINVSSHEIMETVTDPFLSAWYYVNGAGEIGDLCNFMFGARAGDGSDVILGGHHYLIQQEWSNAISGCAMSFSPPAPAVVTEMASAVGASGAMLNGTANPNAFATNANFEYGLTTGYGTTTPVQAMGSGTSALAIGGGGLTGLACGTLYHFRATATNANGTTPGSDATFTTTACVVAPTVTTGSASAITPTGAVLNGTANPNGSTTTADFEYGLTTGYGGTTAGQAIGSGAGAVAIGGGALTGLTCNTPYHFRAMATNTAGTTYGTDATFTTGPCRKPGLDFDGDGRTDIAVFRPSTGTWFVEHSNTNDTTFFSDAWGTSGDIPVPGDYDGDGKADIAVYRPSTGVWYVLTSSSNYTTFFTATWGAGGDIPVSGDYDGDGKADVAVYRPSTGVWYILQSGTNYTTFLSTAWGTGADVPVPGDYDGDGKTDLAVYRPSTGVWYILQSSTNYTTSMSTAWGVSTDILVPGDYDGDGKTDVAVYRPSTGVWYALQSSTNYTTYMAIPWGLSTDIPVPGDYDGDGKTDVAVYRPSTGVWYALQSSTNYTGSISIAWGLSTDIPLFKR